MIPSLIAGVTPIKGKRNPLGLSEKRPSNDQAFAWWGIRTSRRFLMQLLGTSQRPDPTCPPRARHIERSYFLVSAAEVGNEIGMFDLASRPGARLRTECGLDQ